MAEIARKTIHNGRMTEVYSLTAPQDGYIVLDCRQAGVSMADTFAIPVEIAGWLKESIPADGVKPMRSFDAGLEFAARAIRLYAERPEVRTMSGPAALMAVADLLCGGSVSDEDRPDADTWVGPHGAKIIPIRGVVAGDHVVPVASGIVRGFRS
jgi:hypothetical protein